MRFRLIAFLPVAALITFFLLVTASSFVSALERSLMTEPAEPATYSVTQYETECDVLYREIHALSHRATRCDAVPSCEGSPLLCPAAMDREVDREFKRLRQVLGERCDLSPGLLDYAWAGGSDGDGPTCGGAHDWMEAATRGEGEPASFVF